MLYLAVPYISSSLSVETDIYVYALVFCPVVLSWYFEDLVFSRISRRLAIAFHFECLLTQ